MLSLCPVEKITGLRRCCLFLNYATSGEGWCKPKLFLLPTPIHPKAYIFCYNRVLEFLLWNLDFHKGSLVCGWLSEIVLSGDSHTMDESSWSQFMGHCKIHSQDQGLYAHYPTSQQGKTLSESFGIWYWIPELPQRHFCPLMDVKLLLWRVDYTWGMSYSARLLMSLHQFWFKKPTIPLWLQCWWGYHVKPITFFLPGI